MHSSDDKTERLIKKIHNIARIPDPKLTVAPQTPNRLITNTMTKRQVTNRRREPTSQFNSNYDEGNQCQRTQNRGKRTYIKF